MPCRSFGGMETPTTLQNSYCVPKTEDEWRKVMPTAIGKVSFGAVWFAHGSLHNINQKQLEYGGRTEITVQHFLDLVNDRIAPWRLHEIGFKFDGTKNELICENGIIHVGYWMGDVWCNIYPASIKKMVGISMSVETFTDLLTLIKFLTPPVK